MTAAHAADTGIGPDTPGGVELLDSMPALMSRLRREVGEVIVGQDKVVDQLLMTLLVGGHAILEGVPGLAKTLLVNTIAQSLSLDFGRIQFTPDLMPTDVTGTLVFREKVGAGERDFVFRKGPIFTNLLLADEINRTPPKTQAALLEGMSESQVSVGGRVHKLAKPFCVMATQNPLEQEGTYPLPEAQLDRFLMKICIDYPEFEEEERIIERTTGNAESAASPVLGREVLLALQGILPALPVTEHVQSYATRIGRMSRPDEENASAWVKEYIAWGVGPRAAQALIRSAKAHTLLSGRFSVTRSDVRAVALPVLRHRIVPSFHAEAEGLGPDEIVSILVDDVPTFNARNEYDEVSRRILRL